MKPLRVAIFSADPQDHACARLRLLDPIRAIGTEVQAGWHARFEDGRIDIELAGVEDTDLIVVQRTFPRHAGVATLLGALFELGIPVIYEVDDLLTEIPPNNPMHRYSEEDAALLPGFIARCDAITVSTAPLGEAYRRYNPNVYVLPNHLDANIWDRPGAARGPRSGPLRIGYAGSRTHVADLTVAEPALLRICREFGERVELVLFGCETPALATVPGVRRIDGGLGYERYAGTLCRLGLDIALAPLADNRFNRCKSDVKWLEYALAGAAGVYSDIDAYRLSVDDGLTGLLAGDDPTHWHGAIARLVEDADLRRHIAAAARRHVLENRLLEHAAPRYLDAWRRIVGAGTGRAAACPQRGREEIANRLRYAQWLDRHLPGPELLDRHRLEHPGAAAPATIRAFVLGAADDAATARTLHALSTAHGGSCAATPIAAADGETGAISRINAALPQCREDWIVLLRTGDRVAPSAAWFVARARAATPHAWAIYTDEDHLCDDGGHDLPLLKPDFDPILLRNANYAGTSLLLKRETLLKAGGFTATAAALAPVDALLRMLDAGADATGIVHLARVLFHRRRVPGGPDTAAFAAVIGAHLSRRGLAAHPQARDNAHGAWPSLTTTFAVDGGTPPGPVSVLIPTHDGGAMLQRCLETLACETASAALDIIVIDNGSRTPETLAYLDGLRALQVDNLRVLKGPEEFNFSRLINLGAAHARGEWLLLLNDDTAGLQTGWIAQLLAYFADTEVGAVAPRLLLPSGRVQHAGIVLGMSGAADFAYLGAAMDDPGYCERLACDHSISAATAACLLVRTALFRELGGFDEESMDLAFGDFDFCLRLRERGARIVWTPQISVLHEGGHTLKADAALPERARRHADAFARNRDAFIARWYGGGLGRDPCYNPNLSLSARDFRIETQPAFIRGGITEAGLTGVAGLPADPDGSGHYRVIDPVTEATTRVRIDGRVLPGYPQAAQFDHLGIDTLFTQRQVDNGQLAALAALRRLAPGLRIVMDFDDLLTEVPHESAHHGKIWPDIERRIGEACRLADRITVSTAPLAQAFARLHGDVRIVPNGIKPGVWPVPPQPSDRRRLRVGWAGGISHAGDLAMLREVVATTRNVVDWVFFGMHPPGLPPGSFEAHPAVAIERYPAALANLRLDLALAPLAINRFNECKSNLRLLEYGALGIPVIATDIEPYRCGLPATLLPNAPGHWIRAIRERIGEHAALRAEGGALRAAVLAGWTIEHSLPTWLEAWR